MHRIRALLLGATLAFVCSGVPAGAPISAEIVHLASGQVLLTAGHRVEGDEIVLVLRGGGEVRWNRDLIARIEPDPNRSPTLVIADETGGEETLERLLSRPYGPLIQRAAEVHGVDPYLLHALIEVESQYEPRAESPRGAMGLMQLMPALAAEYAVQDPFDPTSNVNAGTRHLRSLIDKFGIAGALAAYNAGEASVRRFDGVPPYPETHRYVERIMDLVDEHQAD